MHLHHLQGVLFYSAKVIKIMKFTISIKLVDSNVIVILHDKVQPIQRCELCQLL